MTSVFSTISYWIVTTNKQAQWLITSYFFLSVPHMCSIAEHRCDHFCINTPGSYVCRCKQGYILNADQRTCSSMLSFLTILPFAPQKHLTSAVWVGFIKENWTRCMITFCNHKESKKVTLCFLRVFFNEVLVSLCEIHQANYQTVVHCNYIKLRLNFIDIINSRMKQQSKEELFHRLILNDPN